VEADRADDGPRVRSRLGRSRPTVIRLAALFAADAFGGGFVVQAFVAFWFTERFHTSVALLGVVFFAIGVLQTASFLAATRLAERFGLLSTMVFTHLPSNFSWPPSPSLPAFRSPSGSCWPGRPCRRWMSPPGRPT